MKTEPYLLFDGRCEEALNFYRDALGAEIAWMMRFREAPEGAMPPMEGMDDKVMHACVRLGENTVMASDGRCEGEGDFAGFRLTLTAADEAEAKRLYDALADGGEVQMALAPTFFAYQFAMLSDRFGVPWMVIVPREP